MSIWRSRRRRRLARRTAATRARPSTQRFEQDQRQRALVLGRLLRTRLRAASAIHVSSLPPGAVAGDGQPHQARGAPGAMPCSPLNRMRPSSACALYWPLLAASTQPAAPPASASRATPLPSRYSGRAGTAPRDRRSRTPRGRTSGAPAPGSASPSCSECRRGNSGRARRRRWRRSAPAASPDCRRHGCRRTAEILERA